MAQPASRRVTNRSIHRCAKASFIDVNWGGLRDSGLDVRIVPRCKRILNEDSGSSNRNPLIEDRQKRPRFFRSRGANEMKHILIFATLLLAAILAQAHDIAGDWHGTLSTGGAELRLVLHIAKSADGSLKATLDSVDQNSNGIPVSSITFKNSNLNLGIDAVHGTYEGRLAPDGKTISGTWTQSSSLPLDFKRATTTLKTEHKPATPSDIDGAWMGTLDMGAMKLRVVFHIVNTEDGLVSTLDSPDQGQKGLPTTSTTRNGASLKIEAKAIVGVFEGKIAPDLQSIEGTFTQIGAPHPLLLKKVKD